MATLPSSAHTIPVPQPPLESMETAIGIPPKVCVMIPKSAFSTAPTVDLCKGDGDSRTVNIGVPQQTSTPVKHSWPSDWSTSGKKMDISKIQATHLLHELSDCREDRLKGGPSPSSSQATEVACGSGGNLPPGLPAQAPGLLASGVSGSGPQTATEVPCPSQQAPRAKKVIPFEWTMPMKHPAPGTEDDDALEIEEIDEVSEVGKDRSREHKEENVIPEDLGDNVEPSTLGVTPAVVGEAREPEIKKKKKKKKSELDK